MNDSPGVAISGTHRNAWPGSSDAKPLDDDGDIVLTAWFSPAQGNGFDDGRVYDVAHTPPLRRAYADRVELARETDADPADRERFTAYCAAAGIRVVGSHWRSTVISGPRQRLTAAFGADVASYRDGNGHAFRGRTGSLHAPRMIAERSRGIFGLHQWPRSNRLGALSRHATPLAARDVAARYAFPDADGSGQTVAVLQFGGDFRPGDFVRCMSAQGLSPAMPLVKRVDNADLDHEFATAKDLEAALDAQILAGLAPGARIVIYQAPNSERGFLDAIRTAIFDREHQPAILSISYGWPEFLWTPAALGVLEELFAAAALLGISVFCSSGDNADESDYDGKPHVVAPASNPYVHACGATCVVADAPQAELPWERAGGGQSARWKGPPWQQAGMRGVPDVAAQQQPGYCVYLEDTLLAAGGTSAVAPVWAALTARLNQRLGIAAGLFTPQLYAARSQWNARSGLGVPNGTQLEAALRAEAASG